MRNVPRLSDQTRLSEEILEPSEELIVGVAQLREPEAHQLQRAIGLLQLLDRGVEVHLRLSENTEAGSSEWA